jgi:hypothetical protein
VPTIPQPAVVSSSAYVRPPLFRAPAGAVAPVQPDNNGTYFYDGGPSQPMPLPAPDRGVAPTFEPKRPQVPLDGKLVSVPGKAPKYSYPAYGESVQRDPIRRDPIRLVSGTTQQTVRVAYPAYGER